jgi:hypothetical protein
VDLSQCILSSSNAAEVRADGGYEKSMTFGKSTSGKSLDFEYEGCQPLSVVPGDGTEVWGKSIWTRGE